MVQDESKLRLVSFLRSKNTAVLSTVDNVGRPHAATISYILDDDLNFFFATRIDSRKTENLVREPQVSITIFDDHVFPVSAQIQGYASFADEIKKETVIQELCERFWRKPQRIPLFFKIPGENLAVVCITIKEVQWLEDNLNDLRLVFNFYTHEEIQHTQRKHRDII
jgi:general stress protein 26